MKKLVTHTETSTGKNTKSQHKTNKAVQENKELIKKAEKWLLPWYHVVEQENGNKYLRSNPDTKKKNNLDPKRKV